MTRDYTTNPISDEELEDMNTTWKDIERRYMDGLISQDEWATFEDTYWAQGLGYCGECEKWFIIASGGCFCPVDRSFTNPAALAVIESRIVGCAEAMVLDWEEKNVEMFEESGAQVQVSSLLLRRNLFMEMESLVERRHALEMGEPYPYSACGHGDIDCTEEGCGRVKKS